MVGRGTIPIRILLMAWRFSFFCLHSSSQFKFCFEWRYILEAYFAWGEMCGSHVRSTLKKRRKFPAQSCPNLNAFFNSFLDFLPMLHLTSLCLGDHRLLRMCIVSPSCGISQWFMNLGMHCSLGPSPRLWWVVAVLVTRAPELDPRVSGSIFLMINWFPGVRSRPRFQWLTKVVL
jgi:hypothetical protein